MKLGLEPVTEDQKTMTGLDAMLLWIGAAIGLGEIWAVRVVPSGCTKTTS